MNLPTSRPVVVTPNVRRGHGYVEREEHFKQRADLAAEMQIWILVRQGYNYCTSSLSARGRPLDFVAYSNQIRDFLQVKQTVVISPNMPTHLIISAQPYQKICYKR